jgi:hypothetical protein
MSATSFRLPSFWPGLSGLALLAGCAATPSRPPAPPPPPPPVAGMERLLGQPPEAAVALLGQPALDRTEGLVRQFQYRGACVLDLYYYPKPGTGMQATYAEARLPDGRDFAAGRCLALLLRSGHSRAGG